MQKNITPPFVSFDIFSYYFILNRIHTKYFNYTNPITTRIKSPAHLYEHK